MTDTVTAAPIKTRAWRDRVNVPVATAFGCIVILLALGSLYSPNFLSPEYLLQQLKVGSFLGIIATGMMLVILLGQIDLSVPWTVSVGAMMGCAIVNYGPAGQVLAIPFGVLCGLGIGLVNGFAVAYLRIPSMIITLAVNAVAQGLMVAYTGGFAPQDSASAAMKFLAAQSTLGIPNGVLVWIVVGAIAVFVLNRTSFGRAVYGIGNKEAAAYLSGVPTQRVVMAAFALCGGLAALGGVLLAEQAGLGKELVLAAAVIAGGMAYGIVTLLFRSRLPLGRYAQ